VVVPPPQSSAADSDLLKGLASASVIASYTPTSESGAPRAGSLAAKPVHEDAQEVDGLIRKLAADINAGRGNVKARSTRLEPELDDGVKALREAAQSMREAAAAASEDTLGRQYALQSALPGEPQKSTLESNEEFAMPVGLPALQPAHERLAEISAALAAENVEVLLEPIRSLADSKPEHYEISLRLKLDDGGLIGAGEVVQLAAGTGLLPLFDALRLERTMRVARKMEERQRPGAVMSGLTAESLADDDFLNVFADTYRGFASTAERLVISFTQDDVRGLTEAQQATLADMRDLGFRFAVTDIVDLDMDFEALVQIGFSFAKLDVAVVMRGMMAGDGLVSSRDVCRSFAKLGYSLVVGGISDDRERAEVLGFGAVFGQGTLFGGPRPVKADIVAAPRTVAA
jgi:cyclic-di-GMP phosphodiesterase TipF (flagellum assembly factor)